MKAKRKGQSKLSISAVLILLIVGAFLLAYLFIYEFGFRAFVGAIALCYFAATVAQIDEDNHA